MPKNTKGGKGAKGLKNSTGDSRTQNTPEPDKEDGTHVAKIVAVKGDCRFLCKIIDVNGIKPKEILIHLPKSSKKFGRITVDAHVLMSLRGLNLLSGGSQGDILYLYNKMDLTYLVNKNLIINDINLDKDGNLVFEDEFNSSNEQTEQVVHAKTEPDFDFV